MWQRWRCVFRFTVAHHDDYAIPFAKRQSFADGDAGASTHRGCLLCRAYRKRYSASPCGKSFAFRRDCFPKRQRSCLAENI